jgi:hypothetical protein
MIDPDGLRLPVGPSEDPRGIEERLSSDAAFDRVYDARIGALSAEHWTPVAVAARAARLLTYAGATRILDIGSGAGKFCIVGALCTGAQFVGVERRHWLLGIAGQAAAEMGATRATFVHSNIDEFSFAEFDGFYLFNPFYEQISKNVELIDDDLERSSRALRYLVKKVEEKLRDAKPPVVVVTYNGFGGRMPVGYRYLGDEPAGSDRLQMWIKR